MGLGAYLISSGANRGFISVLFGLVIGIVFSLLIVQSAVILASGAIAAFIHVIFAAILAAGLLYIAKKLVGQMNDDQKGYFAKTLSYSWGTLYTHFQD